MSSEWPGPHVPYSFAVRDAITRILLQPSKMNPERDAPLIFTVMGQLYARIDWLEGECKRKDAQIAALEEKLQDQEDNAWYKSEMQ